MIHVLDTSALKWAYIEKSKHSRRCRYLLGRSDIEVFVAEITILEIMSALGSEFRGKRITLDGYTRANGEFLRDVAAGQIKVRQFSSVEYIRCRDLLQFVGIDAGRNVSTQDAMVAYTARSLALDRREVVKLLTSDQHLARLVKEVSAFHRLVRSEYLKP